MVSLLVMVVGVSNSNSVLRGLPCGSRSKMERALVTKLVIVLLVIMLVSAVVSVTVSASSPSGQVVGRLVEIVTTVFKFRFVSDTWMKVELLLRTALPNAEPSGRSEVVNARTSVREPSPQTLRPGETEVVGTVVAFIAARLAVAELSLKEAVATAVRVVVTVVM